MLLDEGFESIGEMGKYQILQVSLIFLLLGWPSPAVTIVYTAIEMDHWCQLLPGEHNHTEGAGKEEWIPRDNATGQYDSCHMYGVGASGAPNRSELVPCSAWTYDLTPFGESIVSMYDLVCERRMWLSLVRTCFLLGLLVATLYCGIVSDRFGRKKALLGAFLVSLAAWLMGIFATNITVYCVSRFLVGCCRLTVYSGGILLCVELVGPKWRFFVGIGCSIAFTLGYMALAGLAFAIKDSFVLELSIVTTSSVFLLLVFILPESPRWLLAVGRKEEAMEVMRMIGRRNGKPLPPQITSFVVIKDSKEKRGNILDILRSKILLPRFFVMSFHWLTLTLLYYMLTLNSQTLIPGNFYLNNFLLAFLELPAAFAGLGLSSWRRAGRRFTVMWSAIAVGVCGFITVPLILYEYLTGITVLVMLSKFFVTMCFDVVYIYVGELFPTEVRHVAFAFTNMWGRVSGFFSAYLGDYLVSVWAPLPYLIFGIMGTISGLLNLLLPETLGKNLSETVQEEEMKHGKELTYTVPDDVSTELNPLKDACKDMSQ